MIPPRITNAGPEVDCFHCTVRAQPQSSSSSYTLCQPIRRVACHHCGNIRKNQVKCVLCPQLYCKNCAEKIKLEHGIQVFADGCPVCKKMCCCADKTPYCARKHHCYRKCPVSKSGVSTSSVHTVSPPNGLVESKFAAHPHEKSQPEQRKSNENCIPLDLLAAACEQFAQSAILPQDQMSETTSVDDVSDISSSSGEEDSVASKQTVPSAVELARASLASSSSAAGLALSPSTTTESSPLRKASSKKRPIAEAQSSSVAATASDASEASPTATDAPPSFVWLPIAHNAAASLSLPDVSKRLRLSPDLLLSMPTPPIAPHFELEYTPRLVQDRVVYDWVVRPSPPLQLSVAASSLPGGTTLPTTFPSAPLFLHPILSAQMMAAAAVRAVPAGQSMQ